ncbi:MULTISPECIES: hypothetical protein [unclassified Candidatus Tisiphia]|uniref:hypothetical protein n=1 Tax=unclassified Candidatus Tisiphia TaxID=2996318 RepID=UPI003CCA982B
MPRVISQIGDSTDGEDYELDENNPSSKKHKVIEKMNEYNYNYQYKYRDVSNKLVDGYVNINVSCILKEMGNQLLQSEKVRTEYRENIKSKFISKNRKKYEDLDNKLGRGWGLIVKYYDPTNNTVLSEGASDYFKMNEEHINKNCKNDTGYNNLVRTNADSAIKGNYYLKKTMNIQNSFKNIYKLHKEINIQKQRQNTELFVFDTNTSHNITDASSFLARIKASKKLDKDLGKNHLYDYKHGTKRLISNSITKKTTQQNETLEVSKGGAFIHFKTNEGAYDTIGQELKRLIDDQFIYKSKLKEFFLSSLRGKICFEIVKNKTTETDLIDQLKTDVELIFGIEVKRNPAVLLTNAMFFDLVDKGIYKIEEIADKMPMAMKGAVVASVIIDKSMGKSIYDYREKPTGYKEVKELVEKDESILQDWLKWKLAINKKIEQKDAGNNFSKLGLNDVIEKLKNLKLEDKSLDFIKTDKCSNKAKIKDTEIPFELDTCKGTFRLEWNTTNVKYNVKVCQIQQISAKVFYDLIKDWYGIELSCLNKDDFILLKAAAEPKDPELDRSSQGDFKVLAVDEGTAVSEIELLKYKQKYSKLKTSLDKMDSNKVITDKLPKVTEKINKALQDYDYLTSKQLIDSLGKLFGATNKNKSPDEIMSCLKAIHSGLESSEETIRTKLNLKDPNKHFGKGKVLSIDDLFYEILGRINDAATENNREDILTTLQEYSYAPQEQMNIVGDIGIL